MARSILPAPRPNDIMYSPLDIACLLGEELEKRHHKVTFYAGQGSTVNVSTVRTPSLRPIVTNNAEWQELLNSSDLFMDYIPGLYDQVQVQDMFRRANKGEFDILHFHHPESAMPYARIYPKVPVVYTLHDEIDTLRAETMEAFASPNQHFISISDNQRRGAPDLNYTATVYNGVDTTLFRQNNPHEDYLLFVGRITPYKGVKEAIQVAQQTKSRLIIIGQTSQADQWYFDAHVKPHLNDKILYLGLLEREQLVHYYQKARALLMPIFWEEPFGLTMVEAMACGTPVLAMRRGSVPEVIADGRTGFIVDSTSEMIRAVDKIDDIKREACRRHVKTHFSVDRMITGYEEAYRSIIQQHRRRGRTYVTTKLKEVPVRFKTSKLRKRLGDDQLTLHL